jgi:4'-phosphopantetheinyl transferase
VTDSPKYTPPVAIKEITKPVRKIDSREFRLDNPLSPPSADADLWHIDLDATAQAEARWREFLSPDERERADRFRFEIDRRRYSTARAVLRILLAGYLATSPEQLIFSYSEKGKPELSQPTSTRGLSFNVSHSGAAALLGFSLRKQIGVDVEKIRSDFDTDAIAKRFFSAREQEQLFKEPAERRHEIFFRCWTLKEAFIKALGEGLSHPLHRFDVSLNGGVPVRLTTRPDAQDAERWSLHAIDVGPDYAAAYAVSLD